MKSYMKTTKTIRRYLISGIHVLVCSLFFTSYGCGDDNTYKSVRIGEQEWMSVNLNVSSFRNGDPIPEAKTEEEWLRAGEEGKPVWCYYENDPANGNKYGKLYNWYAVKDPRGLAPASWRVANDDEWRQLTDFLEDEAGGKLKETGTVHWACPNTGATNESGFTALPGGSRQFDGKFDGIGDYGGWWSGTEYGADRSWLRGLGYGHSGVFRQISYKNVGLSVRCIRD